MTDEALISVVVAIYNVKPFLSRCLESIAAQTYHNLEIILVDDGSTDGSGGTCDAFAKAEERCVVIHQQNQGLWAARNAGQKEAKGDYIIFVDGDDYLHVDAVKCLYDALQRHPQCGLAMCRYKRTMSLDDDTAVTVASSQQVITVEQLLNLSDSVLPDIVWNKLYRRSLIDGIWAREYKISQDVDFNLRVFQRLESAVLLDAELYYWVQRKGSAMHQENYRFTHLKIITDICHRNFLECPSDNQMLRSYLLQRLYTRMLLLRLYGRKTGEKEETYQQCRNFISDTWRSYMSCKRINIMERLGNILLLHCSPSLTQWLMSLRRNLKQIFR